jgi:hypothetical protein
MDETPMYALSSKCARKDLMMIITFVDKQCHLKINNDFLHVFLNTQLIDLAVFYSTLYDLGSLIKNLSQWTCRLLLVQVPRFACSLGSIMSAAVCMCTEVGMVMAWPSPQRFKKTNTLRQGVHMKHRRQYISYEHSYKQDRKLTENINVLLRQFIYWL